MMNEYQKEKKCSYKGETYLVRDNGSILRLAKEGQKTRKSDNIWTFGKKDNKTGYMLFCGERVHRIVAIAFLGERSLEYVVDHIDTNRCNNRIENLRWLTKLENVLRNPITVKKLSRICGNIENFLNNPSQYREILSSTQNYEWMRTVSKEEGQATLQHFIEWAEKDTSFNSTSYSNIGEWIYRRFTKPDENVNKSELFNNYSDKVNQNILTKALFGELNKIDHKSNEWEIKAKFAEELNESLTKHALQKGFSEKMYFPLCTIGEKTASLQDYAEKLKEGCVFSITESGTEYTIESVGWTWEWDAIQVEAIEKNALDRIYVHIHLENNSFIHKKGDPKHIFIFCDSANVLQCGAITINSYPSCPKNGDISLEEYANILQKGVLVQKNQYSEGYVIDREITIHQDNTPILYVGIELKESFKPYADMIIFIENGKIIHQPGRTYFDGRYLDRAFCKIRGQEWFEDKDDPIMDDYC